MGFGGVALEDLAWKLLELGDGVCPVTAKKLAIDTSVILKRDGATSCKGCSAPVYGEDATRSFCSTCWRAQQKMEQAPQLVHPRQCSECKQFSTEGASGDDEDSSGAETQWFCFLCWRQWEKTHDVNARSRTARTAENLRQHVLMLQAAHEAMASWSHHLFIQGESCWNCGVSLAALLSFSSNSCRAQMSCAKCWLCRDGNDMFFETAKAVGGWPRLEELFMLLSGPQDLSKVRDAAYSRSPLARSEHLAKEKPTFIIWDAMEPMCACIARAVWIDYASICCFLEMHDELEFAQIYRLHPHLKGMNFNRGGCITAILPSGVIISNCQRHQRILLFELEYIWRVRPPTPEAAFKLEQEYIQPIQRMRSACVGKSLERWWMASEVLEMVGRSLDGCCFAVLDDFLEATEMRSLRADAQQLFVSGRMLQGKTDQGNGYWGEDIASEFTNARNEPFMWNAWGNYKLFVSDYDAAVPGVKLLPQMVDKLISRLKGLIPHSGNVPPHVVGRLNSADLREHVMVASYRGGERGRYLRHTDIGRNAVLTALYYLNNDWTENDKGQLRVYFPGHFSTDVRYDVLPVANRLLLFWSNEDCPHEVLPTARDRYAMTVWYRSADDVLKEKHGVDKLIKHLHPVAPLSVEDALIRTGVTHDQAQRTDLVYRFHTEVHGPKDDDALAAYLRDHISAER